MSTSLLLSQCDSIVTCACGRLVPVFQQTVEAETSCNDVKIVGIICATIVLVALIVKCGFLIWKYIEIDAAKRERVNKNEKELSESQRRQNSDLQDKLLDFLRKQTEITDATGKVTSIKPYDDIECRAYRKAICLLMSVKPEDKIDTKALLTALDNEAGSANDEQKTPSQNVVQPNENKN